MSTVISIQEETPNPDGSTGESTPSSAEAAVVPAVALDMATSFGQMTESFRQSQERQSQLEAELRLEREAREADRRQLDAIGSQVGEVMGAIRRAAEAEQVASQGDDGATRVIPPEGEPPKTPDPPARPSRLARVADWINGR